MNKTFKKIWSKERGQVIAVSEAQGSHTTTGSRKATVSVSNGFKAVLTAVALAVAMATAPTFAAPSVTEDLSAWTVTGSDATLNENLDVTGLTYGRIAGFNGWNETNTNKITIANGKVLLGGVYGYSNDPFWGDEENTGAEGSSGLLRYHTMIVNGTLKDAETYHDVATNADKAQVGTVNWLNRIAVGETGTVNVKEMRVAEKLVNAGSVTVKNLYVKDGASVENVGTMTVNGNAVIGTANATIFDKNLYNISGEDLTAGSSGSFTNTGTAVVNGTLTAYMDVLNQKALSAASFALKKVSNSANGVLKSTDSSGSSVFGVMDNAGEISLAGTSTFDAVTNAGKMTLTRNSVLASLTQTAGSLKAAASLTINGALDNQAGTLNAAALTAKSTVKNVADLTVTGLLTATAATTNSGTLSAGQFQVGDVTNADGGILNATAADMKSVFGVTNNSGDLSVAGESTFGAVTNAKNLTLAKNAVLASLTQTAAAGKTTATAGLTVTGALDNQAGSITAGTLTAGSTVKNADAMTVTGTFTAADTVTNAKSITAGTFNFQDFVNNANAVLKSTDADSVTGSSFGSTDNKGEINLAGIANFGAVKNAGTVKLAAGTSMDSLTQTAGSVTALDALNVEGALDNQAGSIVANSISVAATLTNADTITVTNAVAATGKTINSKTITAGSLNLADVNNAAAGIIKSTATTKSVFGATDNKGEINLAGASEFGAVTNANKLTLTGDAVLASLTQTAGTTTAGAGLTLSADSATAGTVSVTGLLTAAGLTNTGSVTAARLSGKTYTGSGTSELYVTESAALGSLALSDSGKANVTKSLTLGTSATDTGLVADGTTLTVGETLSVVKGATLTIASGAVVSADTLALGDASSAGSATVNSSSASFKHLTAANAGSVLTNGTDLTLDDVNVIDGFTYNQTAGSFKTADHSFFQNATLNIMGGTLDRTASTSRVAGENTLGTGNTVNISGVTPGSFTDKTQVGSDWKDGQTVVSVGILNSDSIVNLKSGGILETSDIALTSNTFHFDGGALTASLTNFFEKVAQKVYKITDGTETTIDSEVLGASDVTDVKDDFKNNIDFTANGGTVVVTDKAVSLRTIATASQKLKAVAGEGADKVNVVFTGKAAGSAGALTGFYHDTYKELHAEQDETSHYKDPGVVFASMAYENKANEADAFRNKLVVGSATEAADTFVVEDSIGFARITGADDVTINSGKTLALVGETTEGTNLLNTAEGKVTVGEGSKFVLGSKGVARTQGNLGGIEAAKGTVNVAMGKFNIKNLALTEATGSTDEGTEFNVATLTDDATSSFVNAGTMKVESAAKLDASYENKGLFTVLSDTALNSKFLNTAGKAIFAGKLAINQAVANAKDAIFKAKGFTVATSLDGTSDDKMVKTSGKIVSDGANTVAGSMKVESTGSLVALDETNITTGRINVLGDSSFKTVNVGSNTERGTLGAGADALIHADTINVGALGTLRLKEGANVVTKNIAVDGMASAKNVNWTLGSTAVAAWDAANADRMSKLNGEYVTTNATTRSNAPRKAMKMARAKAPALNVYKSNVTLGTVQAPTADAVTLAGKNANYVIDVDREDAQITKDLAFMGDIGSMNNMFSGQTDDDMTYKIGKADGQTVTGKAVFLDSVYITEGNKFTVGEGGKISVEDIETQETGYHPGFMIVRGDLTNKGTMDSTTGSGVIATGNGVITTATGATDSGKTLVLTGAGTYKVDGGDASYKNLALRSGTLNVAKGFFGLGTTKAEAGYDGTKSAVLATNQADIEVNDGKVIVGTVAEDDEVTAGSVYFGDDSALALNTRDLADKKLFKGNGSGSFTVKDGSDIVVTNATWGKHTMLSEGFDITGTSDAAWNGEHLINKTNDDMTMAVAKVEGNMILMVGANPDPNPNPDPDNPNPNPDPDNPNPDNPNPDNPNPTPDTSIQALSKNFSTPAIINGLINDDANIALRDPNSESPDIRFIERALDKDYVGKTASGALDVKKATEVWNSAIQLSATSGMNAFALSGVSDTMSEVEQRMTLGQYQKGKKLWVKATGKYAKTDKLESDGAMKGGFEATSAGLIFGADLVKTRNMTVGAAFNYAKSDLKSKGNYTKTDTDGQIYGGNLYGSYRLGDASIIAHAGYATAKGDAKQNYTDVQGNAYRITGDVDSEYVTAGIRGEMNFDVADNLTLTPHLGLRYVYGKTKSYDIAINGKTAWKVDSESSNVWQVPFGVTMQGAFRANAWTIAPYADASVVQTFGDTDTKATVSATGYRAMDSYRYDVIGKTAGELKLGISAEKKNHSFGISYTGSVGSQGSQNHSVTANYNFRF